MGSPCVSCPWHVCGPGMDWNAHLSADAPHPGRVVTTSGLVMVDEGEIAKGQNVWQTLGGMEVGSVWGHGSYVAPDWTADYLHREAVFVLDAYAQREFDGPYDELDAERQAQLRGRLEASFRKHTYDDANDTLTIDPERAEAFAANLAHFQEVFEDGNVPYAIPRGAVTDPDRLRQLTAFFFWSSWAATTNRPATTSPTRKTGPTSRS